MILAVWHSRAAPMRPRARLLATETAAVFELKVNLGQGGGMVEGELQAFFSKSELLTVRYPVPVELRVRPERGVLRVYETGYGLREGDVLRACSTFEMRFDSAARETRLGPGFHGRPNGGAIAQGGGRGAASSIPWLEGGWWREQLSRTVGLREPQNLPELGVFSETAPTKVLFVADGQSFERVRDALLANVPDKTDNVVMLFERPLDPKATRPRDLSSPRPRVPPKGESFSPLTADDLRDLFGEKG